MVKVTVLMRDMAAYKEINDIYSTYFPSPGAPSRAAFAVAGLPMDGESIDHLVTAVRCNASCTPLVTLTIGVCSLATAALVEFLVEALA